MSRHITNAYPIHNRHITDTYEYSMNIPRICHECPIYNSSMEKSTSNARKSTSFPPNICLSLHFLLSLHTNYEPIVLSGIEDIRVQQTSKNLTASCQGSQLGGSASVLTAERSNSSNGRSVRLDCRTLWQKFFLTLL